jgi:hypothetical protein
MAHSSPAEASETILDWFRGLRLTGTAMNIERRENEFEDEAGFHNFEFRPFENRGFKLDITVSDDGYWGMGIMHPEHSETVYAWGFEGTMASCKSVMRIATEIACGRAEIIVPKFDLSKGVGWLELQPEMLKSTRGLTRYDRVRPQKEIGFFKKRIRSDAWV